MIDDKWRLNEMLEYIWRTDKLSAKDKDLLKLIKTLCQHPLNDIMFTRELRMNLLDDRLRVLMQFKQYNKREEQQAALKKYISQLQRNAAPGSNAFKYAATLNLMTCFYDNPKCKGKKYTLKQLVDTAYSSLNAQQYCLKNIEPLEDLLALIQTCESLKEYSTYLDEEIKTPTLTKVVVDLCQQCFNPTLASAARLWLIAVRQRFLQDMIDCAAFPKMFRFKLFSDELKKLHSSEKKALEYSPCSALDYASFSNPLMQIFEQNGVTPLVPVFKLTYAFLDKLKMTIVQSEKKYNDAVSLITLGLSNTPILLQTSEEENTVKKKSDNFMI